MYQVAFTNYVKKRDRQVCSPKMFLSISIRQKMSSQGGRCSKKDKNLSTQFVNDPLFRLILAIFWDFRLGATGLINSFSGVVSIVISGVGDFSQEISSVSFLEIKISSKIQKIVFNCLISSCTVCHFTQFCLNRLKIQNNNFEKICTYKNKKVQIEF